MTTPDGKTTYLLYENDDPEATKGNHWVDMPEGRARARLKNDVPHKQTFVTVLPDGSIVPEDSSLVDIEPYAGGF